MPETRRIVCLANSIKHGGRCVAGIELSNGEVGSWIRPISDSPGHELGVSQYRFADGVDLGPLDVVEVNLDAAAPAGFQTENWRITAGSVPLKIGDLLYDDLAVLREEPGVLFWNGSSSNGGTDDRVPAEELPGLDRSIVLVQPEDLHIVVSTNPYSRKLDPREVIAEFAVCGVPYEMKVSDPRYKEWYLDLGLGRYELEAAHVTVSLVEPWTAPAPGATSYSYKVVAAIIEPGGAPGTT